MVVVFRRQENNSLNPADLIEDEPPRHRREQSSAPVDQPPIAFQAAKFAEWHRRRQEEDCP
jgi:hypothetical protein